MARYLFSTLVLGLSAACGSSPKTNASSPDAGRTAAADASTSPSADAQPPQTEATDFSQAGPFAVTESSGTTSVNGCTLDYQLFTPDAQNQAPLVILGHGFQRDASNVAAIAAHLSSYGVRVATPNYCHSSALDADHQQNGLDAAALSAGLAAGAGVIHAGHSAGGVAALVAAANDDATIAVLGLDMTDANSIGATAASGITLPALGLFGESSGCNSSGNGTGVFESMNTSSSLQVIGATHCDFEAPTSSLCTLFCGGASGDRAATVQTLAAAFVAWQAGLDESGQSWIQGEEQERLVSEGLIRVLP